jgi:hypothetical protein
MPTRQVITKTSLLAGVKLQELHLSARDKPEISYITRLHW